MLSKRTLSGASYALSYDYDDQLTGTGGASFAYDAAGRRVSRTAGGVTTSFLYDGESVLLEQQGGATTASYAYGNALTRKDGETPLFDGQGSERTVTDAGGAVQATLTLSAFGQAVASSGGSTSAYQYAATSRYRNDGDAGLALVGCRYYDAQAGGFISRDTYLDQKPYAYCDGDPVNKVDPSGHASWWRGFFREAEGVPEDAGALSSSGLAGLGFISAGNTYANWLYLQDPGHSTKVDVGGLISGITGTLLGAGAITEGVGVVAVGTGAVVAGGVILAGVGIVGVALGTAAIVYAGYRLTSRV